MKRALALLLALTACVSDSMPAYDAGADSCTPETPKIVFVTSETMAGDFGGVAGAEKKCNDLAKAAGLSGSFTAWISVPGSTAASRISFVGAYAKVGGSKVSSCRMNLVGGSGLESPIDRDEKGMAVPKSAVWTNANAQGGIARDGYDCQGFTKIVPDDGGAASSVVGSSDAMTTEWTQTMQAVPCSDKARLYCFQL